MDNETTLGCLFLSIITAVILVGGYFVNSYKCTSKWPNSFKAEYSLITGCTIETKDGRIPAENYRVL